MKPTLVPPQEKVRRLTDGKWELKAVIDDECERGLAELKRLLSHTNASMTYGEPGNWWDGWRMLRRPGAAPRAGPPRPGPAREPSGRRFGAEVRPEAGRERSFYGEAAPAS